jgi:hypothetical protein
VEGIRTDIRIINLALFPTDWYAGSLKRKVYDSEPFDLKISKEQLKSGAFDYLPYSQIPGIDQNKYYPLSNIVEIMLSNDENVKVETREGRRNAMPTRNFFIPIDKQAIIKAGIVDAKDSALIEDEITFVYPNSNGLNKGDLTLLDLISQNAKNGWKRPIYFTAISGAERTLGLNAYMQLEGLTYRFVPIKNNARGGRRLAGDIMYDNIMNKFKWSGMKEKKNFFVDEKASYVPHSMRQSMLELARMYADEYQMAQQDSTGIISEDAKEAKKKSIALMDKSFLEMPETALPFNRPDVKMNYGFTYIDLGEIEKGKKILEEVISYCERYNAYFKENAKTDKGYYESVQQYYGQILGQMEQYAAQKQLVDIEGKIKQAKQKIAG